MGRVCTVCDSPHLGEIDEAIVAGQPVRTIARRFAPLTRDSLSRHRDAHVSAALRRAGATRAEHHEDDRVGSLLDEAQSALREVKEIVAEAREAGATGVRLQALDRLERFLRLLGAVTGELKPDAVVAVVNIQRSAEWIQIRGILMEELEPYPDLKARIVTRLAATAETGSLRSALPPSMVVANGIGKAEVIVDP